MVLRVVNVQFFNQTTSPPTHTVPKISLVIAEGVHGEYSANVKFEWH